MPIAKRRKHRRAPSVSDSQLDVIKSDTAPAGVKQKLRLRRGIKYCVNAQASPSRVKKQISKENRTAKNERCSSTSYSGDIQYSIPLRVLWRYLGS